MPHGNPLFALCAYAITHSVTYKIHIEQTMFRKNKKMHNTCPEQISVQLFAFTLSRYIHMYNPKQNQRRKQHFYKKRSPSRIKIVVTTAIKFFGQPEKIFRFTHYNEL
jgi:hypothetical protein